MSKQLREVRSGDVIFFLLIFRTIEKTLRTLRYGTLFFDVFLTDDDDDDPSWISSASFPWPGSLYFAGEFDVDV